MKRVAQSIIIIIIVFEFEFNYSCYRWYWKGDWRKKNSFIFFFIIIIIYIHFTVRQITKIINNFSSTFFFWFKNSICKDFPRISNKPTIFFFLQIMSARIIMMNEFTFSLIDLIFFSYFGFFDYEDLFFYVWQLCLFCPKTGHALFVNRCKHSLRKQQQQQENNDDLVKHFVVYSNYSIISYWSSIYVRFEM